MNNYYNVKKFFTLMDTEIKQNENSHRTTINDSMRLAKEAEIIDWLNLALSELFEYNKGSFYHRVINYTVISSANSIEIPFYMRRIDKLKMGDKWYNVSMSTDTDVDFWYMGGRQIVGNKQSFTKDSVISLNGYVSPDIVVDENSYIDFPPTFMRLLLLQVLLYFSGRDNRKKEIWYAQYKLLLNTYKKTSATVTSHGKTDTKIRFGA